MVTLTQAMRELAKLEQMQERRPGGKRELSEVEMCRAINLTLYKATMGVATPREVGRWRGLGRCILS